MWERLATSDENDKSEESADAAHLIPAHLDLLDHLVCPDSTENQAVVEPLEHQDYRESHPE